MTAVRPLFNNVCGRVIVRFVVGQRMSNPLVAADTRLTLFDRLSMFAAGATFLSFEIHCIKGMAAVALGRTVALHATPFPFGHRQSMGIVFFTCINGTRQLMIDVLGP